MENEEYNPQLPNYYNYKAKINNKLDLTFEFTKELNTYNNIYMCIYDVNNKGKYPFQRFILVNNILDDSLEFPQIKGSNLKNNTSIDIINFSKTFLYGLLMQSDYEKFDENLEFNGICEDNNNLYIFYDITKCQIEVNDIEKNNNIIWLALVDEIVNQKHVCNMKINKIVTNFFKLNDDFCFLTDENDSGYEIPIVSYVGKPEKKLNFTYIFGETMSNKNSILGPYYYFTDYYNAFKDVVELEGNSKVGIVRFALFVGNTKYYENLLNDNIDNSEIKFQRLEDDSLDKSIELLSMKISDHDGQWAKNYDSAYLGCIELDNGTFLDKRLVVVKDYNQQVPLSYHYVDKRTYKNDYLIY
jgi:hypothetical protein